MASFMISEPTKGYVAVPKPRTGMLLVFPVDDETSGNTGMLMERDKNPHHKSLASFMARKFFVTSQGTNTWLNLLKEVAKTDFSMVQSLYQNEIVQISKWWKELGLAKELKFARDQPLKWYIWSMAGLADPSIYSVQKGDDRCARSKTFKIRKNSLTVISVQQRVSFWTGEAISGRLTPKSAWGSPRRRL